MSRSRASVSAMLVLMWIVGVAHAGQITDLQLYDGTSLAPQVTIHYNGPDGTGQLSERTYADPMVSGGTSAPLYYCVDPWHDNNLGATYTITPTSSISFASTSTLADVDNRLAWLVNRPQDTVDERAAVQLAMWYTLDNKGFSYSGGGSALRGDYDVLTSFVGYDPKVTYSADFWSATHDARNTLYQDLISAVPGGISHQALVPEPGTLVLAGITLATAGGICAVRRRRPSASPETAL